MVLRNDLSSWLASRLCLPPSCPPRTALLEGPKLTFLDYAALVDLVSVPVGIEEMRSAHNQRLYPSDSLGQASREIVVAQNVKSLGASIMLSLIHI